MFLRAGRQLYISLRSGWFIGLSKNVVIGQRDKIGLQNVNVIFNSPILQALVLYFFVLPPKPDARRKVKHS